jgi:hypothetical protein
LKGCRCNSYAFLKKEIKEEKKKKEGKVQKSRERTDFNEVKEDYVFLV